MRQRNAFTLIELLVVVAIIVALLAILLPALNRAISHAETVQCSSNLHQQTIGLIGYASDHFGRVPGGATYNTSETPLPSTQWWATWVGQTRMYAGGSTDVYYCPSADATAKWTKTYGSGLPARYGFEADEVRVLWNQAFSYGYNNWGSYDFPPESIGCVGLGGVTDHSYWGAISMAQIVSPSQMYAIGETRVDGSWDQFIDSNQPTEFPFARLHGVGLTQISMVDGHVERMKVDDMVDQFHQFPEIRRRWNKDNKPY